MRCRTAVTKEGARGTLVQDVQQVEVAMKSKP